MKEVIQKMTILKCIRESLKQPFAVLNLTMKREVPDAIFMGNKDNSVNVAISNMAHLKNKYRYRPVTGSL